MAGYDDPKSPNSLRQQLQSNNYFERLGLSPGATDADIKKAYRDLAKLTHPNANTGDPRAEENFILLNEAYENLKIGITSKRAEGHGQRSQHRERRPRTPENEQTRKRFDELKTEAADVENFEQGGELAATIAREFEPGSNRRSDLLGYLTRRLHHVLQKQIHGHTTLESLATLAKKVNEFCDSSSGRLLHTAFFTDELDGTALEIGLKMLEKANVKKEVESVLAAIAKYPATFGAIIELPIAGGKQDTMDKIKFLRRIKEGGPRTGGRLDNLIAQVNEHKFQDEKRGELYKKQIIDFIERHRSVYYRNGVFIPLRMSPEGEANE